MTLYKILHSHIFVHCIEKSRQPGEDVILLQKIYVAIFKCIGLLLPIAGRTSGTRARTLSKTTGQATTSTGNVTRNILNHLTVTLCKTTLWRWG